MTKAIKIVFILAIIFIALVAAAFYVFETKIKDQIIPETKKIIRQQSNMDIDFKKIRFSFSRLIKLEPALKIEGLKIGDALYVDQAFIELYLKSLIQKKIDIKQIVFNKVKIKLVENAQKVVSLKGLDLAPASPMPEQNSSSSPSEAITADEITGLFISDIHLQELLVKDSNIEFLPYGSNKAIIINDVNLKLSDLAYGENQTLSSNLELSADLFHSSRSKLSAEAKLGPFPKDLSVIPLSGSQKLELYLQDIPQDISKNLFGEFLQQISNSYIKQNAQISGDLLDAISGKGEMLLNKITIGNDGKHNLVANSQIPLEFWLRLKSKPGIKLESENASVKLSSKDSKVGSLNFDTFIDLALDTGYMQGSSHGSLNGLELQETINCFSKQKDTISGLFAIKDYHLYFEGIDAEEVNKSLKGTAQLEMKNGSLLIMKNLKKFDDIAAIFINNFADVREKLSGEFASLKSDIKISQENLYTNNVELKSPKAKLYGQGVVKKGQYLVHDFKIDVGSLKGLPVAVRGTIEKPSITPNFKALQKQKTEDLVDSILEIGKKNYQNFKQEQEQETKTPALIERKGHSSNTEDVKDTSIELSKEKMINDLVNFGLNKLRQKNTKN